MAQEQRRQIKVSPTGPDAQVTEKVAALGVAPRMQSLAEFANSPDWEKALYFIAHTRLNNRPRQPLVVAVVVPEQGSGQQFPLDKARSVKYDYKIVPEGAMENPPEGSWYVFAEAQLDRRLPIKFKLGTADFRRSQNISLAELVQRGLTADIITQSVLNHFDRAVARPKNPFSAEFPSGLITEGRETMERLGQTYKQAGGPLDIARALKQHERVK
ncbi:MAG: hypothetical protein PHG85_00185 [Candidatus Altiarchaeota archaeon]|nr:hypothetical protein [Candidatus Altiarchaeota archaeon]